jgi:hypothetical protein
MGKVKIMLKEVGTIKEVIRGPEAPKEGPSNDGTYIQLESFVNEPSTF